MKFKDSVEQDTDTFVCCDEFAEIHDIEYESVECVIDTYVKTEDTNHDVGLNNIRIFIPVKDILLTPKTQGESVNVDGTEYIVDNWSIEQGMHVIDAFRYGE